MNKKIRDYGPQCAICIHMQCERVWQDEILLIVKDKKHRCLIHQCSVKPKNWCEEFFEGEPQVIDKTKDPGS